MERLFARAFAIFFPAAGLQAALQIGIWVNGLSGGWVPPSALDPLALHIHEMLFGFLSAVIAGFLLTAVPNWTGRLPLKGRRLALLFLLWLAGRLALLFGDSAPQLAAGIDSLFLLVLAVAVWREILAAGNKKNIPVCILVSLLALANAGWLISHLSGLEARGFERAALGVFAMLIAMIGGRITPSFTRNWLAKRGAKEGLPASVGTFDKIALACVAVALVGWVAAPESAVTGALLLIAGVATLLRLGRWAGYRTVAEPLLLVLHVAYGSLGISLLLLGGAALWPHLIPVPAALHSLTAGTIGLMTLAVMTRAILGHAGRALTADKMTQVIYLLLVVGAVSRVAMGWMDTATQSLLMLAGMSWGAAFVLFAFWYVRLLCLPQRERGH